MANEGEPKLAMPCSGAGNVILPTTVGSVNDATMGIFGGLRV